MSLFKVRVALRVMVARLRTTPAGDWQQYAKEGETAQAVIERERGDNHALCRLLADARRIAGVAVPGHQTVSPSNIDAGNHG